MQTSGSVQPANIKNSKGTPVTTGSGTATITLYPTGRQVCWSITVHGIHLPAKATTSHSVKGGSTVVTLSVAGTSCTSCGCTRRGVSRSTISSIQSNPKQYYLVVDTTDYPARALRGTL